MKRAEIDQKFDEIVAFAELEKFLDTPVKHYSSGMYVRLAFAVAAHLDPEILLVDEVLAVGDAVFQKKCLGKMGEVAGEGRTVLFVSHNMSAVQALCSRTVWIDDGKIASDGGSEDVIDFYLGQLGADNQTSTLLKSVGGEVDVEQVITRDRAGNATRRFRAGSPITVEICYFARHPVINPYFWVGIKSRFGPLFSANMLLDGARPGILEGRGSIRCTFEGLPLLPKQTYSIVLGGRLGNGRTRLLKATEVTHFKITGTAEDLGFRGEPAEIEVGNSISAFIPYYWEFANGQRVSVDPLHGQEENNGIH
jgi:lipopolysaccharide transport system ATP-binding protein